MFRVELQRVRKDKKFVVHLSIYLISKKCLIQKIYQFIRPVEIEKILAEEGGGKGRRGAGSFLKNVGHVGLKRSFN